MLNYKAIEIFTSEEARYRNKPVADAVMQSIRDLKIAARCIVTRGIAGCYESGELATGRLEILSFNLPIRIYIVIPAVEVERVLSALDGMINDGIVALHDLNVLIHRTHNAFFPRQLMVRDVMTADPQSVIAATPLSDVARLLLPSIFTGLPVLDERQRPIGVITQGDLIRKGGLPLRLGLLAESNRDRRESVLTQLASLRAEEVMSSEIVIIAEDRPLAEAVDLMLAKGVKRLPVVDGAKRLVGMLSRLDIFRTVMREKPDLNAFRAQKIEVEHLKYVGDILRRDTHAVSLQTSIEEVIRIIDDNDIQRVAVVDPEGKLLGLISDRDLLRYFKPQQEGIWHMLAKIKHPFKQEACESDLGQCLTETTAGEVMISELIKVREEMLIEEAIGLMIEKGLKRLPVVDDAGCFKGMISRDSLLRTGFSGPA
jgi:CBS domain-containing protein/PII-like signaling protein